VPPDFGWGINVQKQMVKVVIALLLVASLILVSMPLAMGAQGWHHGGMGRRMAGINEIYEAIAVTNSTATSAAFNVLGAAIRSTSGNVTMINMAKPVPAQYYFANRTFVVPAMNRTPGMRQRPVRTSYGNATISPAGASAVIALKNITMLKADNTTMEFQFTGLSVYLPTGKVMPFTFSTPVKIVKTWKAGTSTISDPAVVSDIANAVKGGAKFPANAAPVPLKTIDV